MNVYSDSVTQGVSAGQIAVLTELLRDSAWRGHSFIKARYSERSLNFGQTLNFLKAVGWVELVGSEIRVVSLWMDRLNGVSGLGGRVALLDALLESRGDHQSLLAVYLTRFIDVNGVMSLSTRGNPDLTDTWARDFLMDLGAVRHDIPTQQYVLEEAFYWIYVWAMSQRGPSTAEELTDDIIARSRVGRGAELAVLVFERQRVGSEWAHRIRDVSGEHPTAPYDVKSVTVARPAPVPRYIEVKAVSAREAAFHWSAAEIEAARLLSSNFFLYLVPALGPDTFDVGGMQIIADPYKEVYLKPSRWDHVPTSFLCRPKITPIL